MRVWSLFIKDLAYPIVLFSLASIFAWLGEEAFSSVVGGEIHALSFAVFVAGLVWVLVIVYRTVGEAEKKDADRNKSTDMQESPRRGNDDKKPIFPEVAYDLTLLVGGGVTGAVVAIYYSRMIPEPSPDLLWLRLLGSLVIVVAFFLPLLYVMKRSVSRHETR